MSTANATNAEWIEEQKTVFAARTHAAAAFFPELKRAFLELTAEEPFAGRFTVSTDAEPYELTVSAGLLDLRFAADVFSDTIFYAFTSVALVQVIPAQTSVLHHGVLNLTRGYWGVIDSPAKDVHKVFVDDPQAAQYLPLADRVARWGLEELLKGYPGVSSLEETKVAAAKTKEEIAADVAKKEGRG